MKHSLQPGISERAERWGALWGSRAGDWSRSEEQHAPVYEAVLARLAVRPGQRALDVGCGSGVFLRHLADHGATPFGLDASEALLALARDRVPEADLRVGDMEQLPYEDDAFDLVTGFTSFFFAVDIVAALREAGRVAKPGAPVVVQVWGRPERNDLEAMKAIARRFLPPPPPGQASTDPLWRPGVLEGLAERAGLAPRTAFDVAFDYVYPDADALGRLLLAPAGLATLVGPEHEEEVRAEIVETLAPYREPGGAYRLRNEYHHLIAQAP
jgi:SAM-dependent methyltransferase